MGMDVTVSRVHEIKCPDCGIVVTKTVQDYVESSGRGWYGFLQLLGYYVPYDERTEENDWYGKDMELTEPQARGLVKYAYENDLYCKERIESLIAIGLLRGDKIVINADW